MWAFGVSSRRNEPSRDVSRVLTGSAPFVGEMP
jgi:hypothetical protein